MIYINWFHQNVPRIFGVLSFIINPIFIYLVITKSRSQMGNYKILLIVFAIFNVFYSICDILTPIGITGNTYGFIVFLTEGPFFENPEVGQQWMFTRCSFISLSYALLIINFLYRYCALFHPEKLPRFFQPLGIITSITFLLLHGASWAVICQQCLAGNQEIREIIKDEFIRDFGVNASSLPMLAAIYYNASDYLMIRGWLGIGLLTLVSVYAMTVYLVLGLKITRKIRLMQAENNLSKNCLRLQKQLFQTLIVQTCIPVFASFLPTVIAWYAPIFGLSIEWWNMHVVTVALTTFPFIDPLAVIYLIPSYRNAIFKRERELINDSSSANAARSLRIRVYIPNSSFF